MKMTQEAFRFDRAAEARKRDRALDLLETYRGDLVDAARAVAEEIAGRVGHVTSPEVLAELRERGLGEALDSVDRRFMGAVFRKGWRRVGLDNSGSHRRPVSVWVRQKAGA